MQAAPITTPQPDTRAAQAARVADYLERHPGATAREIDAACDVGSITKVLSDMAINDPEAFASLVEVAKKAL